MVVFMLNYLDNGLLYSFGSNRYGQLGNTEYIDAFEPKVISYLKGNILTGISCGPYCTFAVLSKILKIM